MDTAWVHFHSHMGKKLNRAAFSNEVRKDTTERQWKGVRYRKSKQNIYYWTQEHKLHREWHEQHKYKGAFSYYIPEITVKRKDLTYNWVQRGLATSQGRNAHGGLLITLHGCNLQLQVSSLWSWKDLSMFKYTLSCSVWPLLATWRGWEDCWQPLWCLTFSWDKRHISFQSPNF